MPPRIKFTRHEVLRAAVRVVESDGIGSLTARSVAASLGASTAPVYSHFSTMDELALAVVRETESFLVQYTSRAYTDRVFLNMGTGIIMFACEHPRLYRALLLEGDRYRDVVQEFLDRLESDLIKDKRFTSLTSSERNTLLNKMWTFTHGFASLVSVGLIKDCTQDHAVKALVDIGTDVIGATLAKHNGGTKTERPGEGRARSVPARSRSRPSS